ncbi:hypothetical protein ON010_g13757 [Phytophthora cinnamomi]|nr:hypothetical protein ON010_g13757 [Phytophthora cinnamomi]
MEVDSAVTVDAAAAPEADAASQGSPNNNLPSLAEILHLGGAEGQAAAAAQDEKAPASPAKADEEEKTEAKEETKTATEEITTETAASTQTRPEDCKCNCQCSAHGGKKPAVEETTTQPRPEES